MKTVDLLNVIEQNSMQLIVIYHGLRGLHDAIDYKIDLFAESSFRRKQLKSGKVFLLHFLNFGQILLPIPVGPPILLNDDRTVNNLLFGRRLRIYNLVLRLSPIMLVNLHFLSWLNIINLQKYSIYLFVPNATFSPFGVLRCYAEN
jgi:hypothetical protein